jgi:hypothetical protein
VNSVTEMIRVSAGDGMDISIRKTIDQRRGQSTPRSPSGLGSHDDGGKKQLPLAEAPDTSDEGLTSSAWAFQRSASDGPLSREHDIIYDLAQATGKTPGRSN